MNKTIYPKKKKAKFQSWNKNYCQIKFENKFPPLVRLLKIQLCSNPDTTTEQIFATEYISIFDICKEQFEVTSENCLPTYGTRYIDMYNKPENKRTIMAKSDLLSNEFDQDEQSILNYNSKIKSNSYESMPGNCALYVARLLLEVQSTKEINELIKENSINELSPKKKKSADSDLQNSVSTEIPKTLLFKPPEQTVDFLAFIMINEVSMIDKRFSDGKIRFQLCIGIYPFITNDKTLHFNIITTTFKIL